MTQQVVIVGGSLAGLLHGIALKHQGHNVTVLEKDPADERSSHNAGLSTGQEVKKFLARYDRTGQFPLIPHNQARIAYRKSRPSLIERKIKTSLNLSSWGALYRLLRANFDGFASEVCPNPPPPEEGNGTARYVAGKEVTALKYADGVVTLNYIDVASGKEDSIKADLVIGADGIHSTVRTLVNAPVAKQFAGFVIWRGTVPEKLLSQETADYFHDRGTWAILKNGYVVLYAIPTDSGNTERGERLINFVWYCNITSDAELQDVFTDKDGKLHRNTVSRQLLRADVGRRYMALGASQAVPPVAEVMSKCTSPLVTKAVDAICKQNSFYDGHVLLVGDALAALRPHVAQATELAAYQCNLMVDVMEGRTDTKTKEWQVSVRTSRLLLLSRAVGSIFMRRPLSTFWALGSLVVLVVRQKLGTR